MEKSAFKVRGCHSLFNVSQALFFKRSASTLYANSMLIGWCVVAMATLSSCVWLVLHVVCICLKETWLIWLVDGWLPWLKEFGKTVLRQNNSLCFEWLTDSCYVHAICSNIQHANWFCWVVQLLLYCSAVRPNTGCCGQPSVSVCNFGPCSTADFILILLISFFKI